MVWDLYGGTQLALGLGMGPFKTLVWAEYMPYIYNVTIMVPKLDGRIDRIYDRLIV